MPQLTVGVVGHGSIGSIIAQGMDHLGHDVIVHDANPAVARDAPFPARALPVMADGADLILVSVPTPTTQAGPDVSAVEDVLANLQATSATVCLRSTMPPGTTARLAERHDLPLVYSPEFLRDRSDVADFFDPDRVVLAGPRDERAVVREAIVDQGVHCPTVIETDDYLTAEIGKEAHNALFATKVSYSQQIRMIAEAGGADPETCMDIVTADERTCGSHLDPTLGPFGGACLPKDTRALLDYARDQDAPDTLLWGTLDINHEARERYQELDISGTWPDLEVVAADGDGS